jgi:hypothetical protein
LFDTSDEAMTAGALYAENQSLLNNGNEQCGLTYAQGGQFSFTVTAMGSYAGCQPADALANIPAGAVEAGGYHSHGVYDPAYANERFSGQPGDSFGDVQWSSRNGVPLSVATPGGLVIIYYPGSACQDFMNGYPLGTGTTIPTRP